MKSLKNYAKLLAALFTAATVFLSSGCETDSDGTGGGISPGSSLTSVSIDGTSGIAAAGDATLTAMPTYTGDIASQITYKWEITSGDNYATLSATSGKSVSIRGKNTTQQSQSVTVKVTASYGKNSVSGTKTITVLAKDSTSSETLTGVSISGSSEIEATGDATLTATPTYTGNIASQITYNWVITSGTGYATLSATSGESVSIIGNNTTNQDKNVTVKVTASYNSTTVTNTHTVTVAAVGVTVENKLTGLELVPSASTVACDGQITLAPQVTYTGTLAESDFTVSGWEITSGNEYAELIAPTSEARSGLTFTGSNTRILKANNTTDSQQTVEVSVTVSAGEVSLTESCTVTIKAANIAGGSPEEKATWIWNPSNANTVPAVSSDTDSADSTNNTNVTLIEGAEITTSNATDSEGTAYSKALYFSGSGSTTSKAVKFTVNGACKIYVVTRSVGDDERKLVLYNGATKLHEFLAVVRSANPPVSSYDYTGGAGSLYLYSANKGINVYLIKIVYGSSSTPSIPAEGTISLTDTPTGYAGYGYTTSPYYTGSQTITIRATDANAAETLKNYANKGNYVIYIDGMIDMTYNSTYGGSMLPTSWNDDNAALGKFIAAQYNSSTMTTNVSKIESWSAWRQAYSAFCTQTGDNSDYSSSAAKTASTIDRYQYELVKAWKSQIQIPLASNTTIIGLTSSSGIKGGSISISGVNNIMIRNLHLQDAFDPFPHHETSSGKTDGWNAEYDCITIQDKNSYIWIDHCTFEDTISVGWTNFAGVKTGSNVAAQPYDTSNKDYEMWQTYDGLCDIKGKTTNVTVSYCVFRNHDKTMLLGSDDDEKVGNDVLNNTAKTITLHHNYFDSCVQRLPFVRTANIHIYNNYFRHAGTNGYDQKASIQIRAKAWVISEYNNFGTGISYRYNGHKATEEKNYTSATKLYDANNEGVSKTATEKWTTVTEKPFTTGYTSEYDNASALPTILPANAGAGVWTVQQ